MKKLRLNGAEAHFVDEKEVSNLNPQSLEGYVYFEEKQCIRYEGPDSPDAELPSTISLKGKTYVRNASRVTKIVQTWCLGEEE